MGRFAQRVHHLAGVEGEGALPGVHRALSQQGILVWEVGWESAVHERVGDELVEQASL